MVKGGVKLAVVCCLVTLLFFGGNSVSAKNVDYNVNINASLNLTLSANSVELNLMPNNTAFGSGNLNATVSTNNLTGYNLIMSASGTNLVNSSDNTKFIPTLTTLAGGYTENTFETNKWGYKVGNGNYMPFVSGTTLSSNNAATNADTSNLAFAAKIDNTMAIGAYSLALTLNAVANPTPTYMQNMDSSVCTATPTLVVDNRDEQEYIVQRLADGNCWMMTNLNLGSTTLTQDLNKYNTNISNTISAATFNGWKRSSSGNAESYTDPKFDLVSGTDSTTNTAYGALYNYCAISAGTVCSDSVTTDATSDLCPAGWRLPTGGSDGEFVNLTSLGEYDTYAEMRAPVSSNGGAFTLSGLFIGSAPSNKGNYGYFWSSTGVSGTNVSLLQLSTTTVTSNASFGKSYGRSARCVMKTTADTISTMQQIASLTSAQREEMIDSMVVDKAYSLRDARDNEEYKVAKLADGNIWMLDNLRLGGDSAINLTPANTNIKSNWTLPASGTVCFSESSCTGTDGVTTGDGYTVPAINAVNKSETVTSYGDGSGKVGVYYNYCAVSAGTYCYAKDTNVGDAEYDICPAGWRLPTAGDRGEDRALDDAYSNNSRVIMGALSITLAGIFANNSLSGYDSSAKIWSSQRVLTNKLMYTLNAWRTGFGSVSYSERHYVGASVRCIFGLNPIKEKNIVTMQELGNLTTTEKTEVVDAMVVNRTYTLRDTRDNEEYKVVKLHDGRVWMLDNLRLGSDSAINLTPADTNINFNWALPASGTDCFYTSSCTGTDGVTTGDGYTVPAINAAYKNDVVTSRVYGKASDKRGVYYNYCAVSAGTYCYAANAGVGNAEYDICPAGWRLPTGYYDGEYEALYDAYSRSDDYASRFLATSETGLFYNGTHYANGRWWSSTYNSNSNMYTLYHYYLSSGRTFTTSTSSYRYHGIPVRCILK